MAAPRICSVLKGGCFQSMARLTHGAVGGHALRSDLLCSFKQKEIESGKVPISWCTGMS